MAAIAEVMAPGGVAWVRCLAQSGEAPSRARPWPVTRRELRAFEDAGLRELEFCEESGTAERGHAFTVVYRRD